MADDEEVTKVKVEFDSDLASEVLEACYKIFSAKHIQYENGLPPLAWTVAGIISKMGGPEIDHNVAIFTKMLKELCEYMRERDAAREAEENTIN